MASGNDPRSAKRRRIGTCLVVVLLSGGAIATFWVSRERPPRLLERGLAAGRRDPAAGAQLLRRAIERSGGRYPDAEIALCQMLGNQGAWESVPARLAAIELTSCRSDLLLAFALAALNSGHADEAHAALEVVRRRGTRDSLAALELLVASLADRGSRDELISVARDLTLQDPDNPRYWDLLIDLLREQVRREPECLAAIRAALEQDLPDESRRSFQYRLVAQLIVCGQAAEARKSWQELSETEQGSLRLKLYEIDILRLEGKLDLALEAMNSVFPELTDRPQAHLNRGVIYLDMGRLEEARRDLEQAVRADPHNASARFKLSEAYRGLGRQDEARQHRDKALDIGRRRERIERLLREAERGPDDRSACEELAKLFREIHDEESARKWQARAERLGGTGAKKP